jgi:hypothetical protein
VPGVVTLYAINGSRARVLALVSIGVVAFGAAFAVTYGNRAASGSQGDTSASAAEEAPGGGVPHALSPVAALPALGTEPARPTASSTPAPAPLRRTAQATRLPSILPPTPAPGRVLAPAPVSSPAPAAAPTRPAAPQRSSSSGTSFDDSG